MRKNFIYSLLLLPFFTVLFFTPGKSLAMMEHIPFDQIISKTDLAFLGTVVDKQCRYTEKPKMIDTDVTFYLDRILFVRDRAVQKPNGEIILTFAGGATAEGRLYVSDVPEFEMGSQYIVLARSNGKSYMSAVVGGTQGLFKVVADEKTTTLFPITYSNHAISKVNKNGKIIRGPQAFHGIKGGKTKKPIYTPQDTLISSAIAQPVPDSGALSASRSTTETRKKNTKTNKAETLMTLEKFLSRIQQMHDSEGRK